MLSVPSATPFITPTRSQPHGVLVPNTPCWPAGLTFVPAAPPSHPPSLLLCKLRIAGLSEGPPFPMPLCTHILMGIYYMRGQDLHPVLIT